MRDFININSNLYQDHGGIIHGARGLNFNIALGRPCCFLDNERVSATTASSSVVLTIASVELSLQQPGKISSSSDGGISDYLRYTGALLNLDGNLDEFRACSPESSSEVLWKIQPFICYGIPISTTPQNFSLIRPSKLREPSD